MKILVVNAGSSSLKFQLFDALTEAVLIKGHYDGIGVRGKEAACVRKIVAEERSDRGPCALSDHSAAIADMLKVISEWGLVSDPDEISAVGHRVVHGGETYSATTRVDSSVEAELDRLSSLAPLHNPINLACIRSLASELPKTPQFAVFDTAFHQTMPEKAFLYALPYSLYKKFGIRKYGFHGTSHKYVALKAAEMMGRNIDELDIVTCHLGNGQSVCAVKNGRSVDTSMGFTPLEGLPMGTRSGSFDPEIVLFLLDNGYTPETVKELLNRHSGLLGLSGISSDHRVIEERALAGDPDARRAADVLANRITGIIGAYAAEMGGLDIVVFTGGIGEHSSMLRSDVTSGLGFLGLHLDKGRNEAGGPIITRPESRVSAMVIPTNEELQIMREAREALKI